MVEQTFEYLALSSLDDNVNESTIFFTTMTLYLRFLFSGIVEFMELKKTGNVTSLLSMYKCINNLRFASSLIAFLRKLKFPLLVL